MKKKLYIDNVDSVIEFGIIYFSFKKLYKYVGPNFTDFIFTEKSEIKTHFLDDKIELEKLINSEKNDKKTKCNFKIKSSKLEYLVIKESFIRLNLFEQIHFYFWKHPGRLMWIIGSLIVPIFLTIKCNQDVNANKIDKAPDPNAISHIKNNSFLVNDSLSSLSSDSLLLKDSIINDIRINK